MKNAMDKMRRKVTILNRALSLTGMILLLFVGGHTRSSSNLPTIKTGKIRPSALSYPQGENHSLEPAPEAVFKDGKGNKVKISELKGKVIFINFWATWCMPCRAEMPTIAKLYDQFKDNADIVFLIVDADDNYARSSKYLAKKDLDLPLYLPAGNIPYVYLSGAIPTTIMINKKGEIVFRHAGAADYSDPKIIEFVKKMIEGEA